VGFHPERLRQRPEDVLPFEEAVGEIVEPGLFLDANERAQVIGERAIDRLGADTAAVDPAGCRDDLLRTRIDAVLIRKNVDPKSVDETP